MEFLQIIITIKLKLIVKLNYGNIMLEWISIIKYKEPLSNASILRLSDNIYLLLIEIKILFINILHRNDTSHLVLDTRNY